MPLKNKKRNQVPIAILFPVWAFTFGLLQSIICFRISAHVLNRTFMPCVDDKVRD